MRGFGRLFLAAFFLVNAGFTVVLTRCSMAEAAPGMACCCGGEGMCSSMETPLAPGDHAVTSSTQACQSASIIGGNTVDPTVVGREFTGVKILKVDILPDAVRGADSGRCLDLSSSSVAVAASNTSPPPVETYVLNATFRI